MENFYEKVIWRIKLIKYSTYNIIFIKCIIQEDNNPLAES